MIGRRTRPIGWRGFSRLAAFFAGAAVLSACSGAQAPLDPTGDKAGRIATLFEFFTAVSVIVWIAVIAVMLVALFRRRSRVAPPLEPEPASERRMGMAVAIASAAMVVTLIVLTVSSYVTTEGFAAVPSNAVRITLTGKQWWWQAEYEQTDPSHSFTTANELHVPVGRPVHLTLESNDVIHSFWVPNLAGKMDLIPGHTNSLVFTATKSGTYRGQCAEFCGLQHAHMALLVVAETPAQFEVWRARESADAQMPAEPERTRGLDVFISHGCIACHSIRGTEANGLLGPDLTHVASRQTIAAGTLPNSRGNLQGWIADPQGVKPGAQMPRLELSAADLNAVTDYIAGLK
jgi:cytochrome c oxidase subunit 2